MHETAEEMVVHPRARREIKDGDSVVDARLEEEHEAKEQLSKIEDLDIGSQEFIDALTRFRDAVVDHAEHEENEEFNKLQRKLDADDLKRMAGAVRAAEAIAPTRPHPGVERRRLLRRRTVRVDARPRPRHDQASDQLILDRGFLQSSIVRVRAATHRGVPQFQDHGGVCVVLGRLPAVASGLGLGFRCKLCGRRSSQVGDLVWTERLRLPWTDGRR